MEFALIAFGLVGFYTLILPILLFTARGRVTRLEAALEEQKEAVSSLRDRLERLSARQVEPQPSSSARQAPAEAAPAPQTATVETVARPPRDGSPVTPAAPPVAPPVVPPGATPVAPPPPVATPESPESASQPPPVAPPRPITPSAPPVAPPPRRRPVGPHPPGYSPVGYAPPSPPPPPPDSDDASSWGNLGSFNWESFVGVKLFSAIAGVALLLAAVFFLRYSLDHGFLQPPVRVAIGVIVGVGLLVACELRAANRYRVTANALDASAIAILFSTFFAAHALWHLIPVAVTFVLLIVVTAVAVLLSVRRRSLFIAVLGLLGGFAAPALLSTGQNNPIGLFGYLLLLNAGLSWVAYTRRWPSITALTLVFTTLYQWGWLLKFLTAASLPLAVGIFLVFPIVTVFALAVGARREQPGETSPVFSGTAGASAVLPLLLAAYIAAVPAYGARYGILFGFLFCIDAGLFAIATWRGPAVLHAVGGITTLVVFALWLGLSYAPAAWPAILAIVSAFSLFYLAAPLAAAWMRREPEGSGRYAVFAAPLLLAAFPVLVIIEPSTMAPGLLFGTLALLVSAIAAYAVWRDAGPVYALAALFAIVTEAFWSSAHLSPARLYAALMVYGGFALLFVAVPTIARRSGRDLWPPSASPALLLASLLLAGFLTGRAVAAAALWGLAGLIAVIVTAITVEAKASERRWFAPMGMAVAWIFLGLWWLGVQGDTLPLLPLLAVVSGFGLLTMALSSWLRADADAGDTAATTTADMGLALSLIGHVFLAVIAAQPALALPPWPIFAVLFVLDLALTAAALHQRRSELQIAGLSASAVVLGLWTLGLSDAPWPLVSMMSALALAAYGLAWMPIASRARVPGQGFVVAAAVACTCGELLLIVAADRSGAPGVGILAGAHVALIAALLALATREGWAKLALAPLAVSTLAIAIWSATPSSWQAQLGFAAAIYACFIAWPVVLGRRVGANIEPYRTAVLASVPFLLVARSALIAGGFGPVIGALPVVQAVVMLGLLVRLLRLEPPGERTLGRLALVAGAALAGITVAIPMQLEREWLTIGWALEGVALAWLYLRIPHRGLLAVCAGLLAVVFVRLTLDPSVFVNAPRSATRIWNWYLYTYLIAAASCFVAARLLRRTDDTLLASAPRVSTVLPGVGTLLLFLVLNIEIADYYSVGPTLSFHFSATLAQDLTYTLGWGVFALALLAAGIYGRHRAARMASITLLLITVLKCFLHDLARLGGLYLVASFVGLAVCLALVALALQRFVLIQNEDAA